MAENEYMLKRLQDQRSAYDVSAWESERKIEIERIKNICQYKPSLIREQRVRVRRKHTNSNAEPNRQLFDLYQKSIREGSTDRDAAFASLGGGVSSIMSESATKTD